MLKIFKSLKSIFKKNEIETVTETFQKEEVKNLSGKEETKNSEKKARPKRKQWTIDDFKVEPHEGKKRFHDFDIPRSIMHAIADLGYQYCTPIQAEILEDTLKGRDAIGKAQTGTGKTAAFLIALYAKLIRNRKNVKTKVGAPRALILAPTRELVIQISKDAKKIGKYNRFTVMPVYGGMDYKKQQERLKTKVVDIVVSTTGRLMDFVKNKDIDLSNVEVLVLDEADAMLDMGFIPEVKKIIRLLPNKDKRQTLFFSATINYDVENLASMWTNNPIKVEIEPEQVAVSSVEKITYTVTEEEKYNLLYNLLNQKEFDKTIVFCNRKDETRDIYTKLYSNGINCASLSGDIDQKLRLETLDSFKSGKLKVLIATDVAGRGIHIPKVSHVINYTLPDDPEDYVHRIGRTGRAGETGVSINLASEIDSFNIPIIEDFIGEKLECIQPPMELLKEPPAPVRKAIPEKRAKRNYNNKNRNNRNNKNYKKRPYKGNKNNFKKDRKKES